MYDNIISVSVKAAVYVRTYVYVKRLSSAMTLWYYLVYYDKPLGNKLRRSPPQQQLCALRAFSICHTERINHAPVRFLSILF